MDIKPVFQPAFNAGKMFQPLMDADEAFINGLYDGVSYQSVLNMSLDQSYFHMSLDQSYFHPPLLSQMHQTPITFDFSTSTTTADFQNKLKFPKVEPLLYDDFNPYYYDSALHHHRYGGEVMIPDLSLSPPFQTPKFPKLEPVTDDFYYYSYPYPNNNDIILNEPYNYSNSFSTLPDLRSVEQYPYNYTDFFNGESSLYSTETLVKPKRQRKPYEKSTTRTRTRTRSQKLSEKTRSLEKLLPWDKKMDTATMLEEAYKYVKFLKAQVSVLQNMPILVEGGGSSYEDKKGKESCTSSSVCGTLLERLNRQQLLQVVLNSAKAQTYLYSKGCCVYSAEQLVEIQRNDKRNALNQQMLFFTGLFS